METNKEYNRGFRYVAYDAANGEYQEFKTIKEAEAWLTDCDDEGISQEACDGRNYIAEIQYKSVVTPIETKEDYCNCSDEYEDFCPNCNREVWPYSGDCDYIANHEYVKINWNGNE